MKSIHIAVVNSPTILMRVILIIKRRGIYISNFNATENPDNVEDGILKITVEADAENLRFLKSQLEKLIDVIGVEY